MSKNQIKNNPEDQNLELYKIIAEDSSDLISILTFELNPKYIYINRAHSVGLGYNPEDLIGKVGMDYVHPSDRLKLLAILKKYLTNKINIFKDKNNNSWNEVLSYRVLSKDGSWRHVTTNAKLVQNRILMISKDVTKNKIQEEKIKEHEKNFRKLFDSSPRGMMIYELRNNNLILVDGNPASAEILGIDTNKILGKTINEVFHNSLEEDIVNEFVDVAKSGKVYEQEAYTPDDPSKEFVYKILAFQIGTGRIVVSFSDVKEKIDSDKKIKENEKLLNTIFESASDAIFVKDKHLRYTHINSRTEKLLGKPASEIIGNSDDNLMDKERATHGHKIDMRVLGGEFVREQVALSNGKNMLYYHITKLPLRSINDEIIGVCGYAHDITGMIKKEKEIKNEKDKIEKYLELLSEIIVALDINGKVTKINQSCAKLLGYEKTEIIGKNWFDNFIPEKIRAEQRQVFLHLISGNVNKNINYHENIVSNKAGDEIIIAWHNTVLKDDEGKMVGTLSSGQDVTQIRKNENDTKMRTLELERLNSLMIGRELKMVELKKRLKELGEKDI